MGKVADLGEFALTKALREKIFKIPLLPQEQVIERFLILDETLKQASQEILIRYLATQRYFLDIVYRVVSGTTLGKNLFDREDREDDPGAPKTVFKKSEMRFLKEALPLAWIDTPEEFSAQCQRIGFVRGVWEEFLESFVSQTRPYLENLHTFRQYVDQPYVQGADGALASQRVCEEIENSFDVKDRQAFLKQIQSSQAAWDRYVSIRQEIISPYFRMLYTQAKKFSTSDAQTLDNFQNGMIGILKAVKCYTPARVAAFSVVATMWIRQSILLNLKSEVNFIKLPIAVWHSYQKLERIRQELENSQQDDVTLEQIAKKADVSVEKIQKIYETVKVAQVYSLDSPTQNEDEQTAHNHGSFNLQSIVDQDDIQERLATLNEYEKISPLIEMFDPEEQTLFGLISGCLELIPEPHLDPQAIYQEKIRQKAASVGISFKFRSPT